MKSNTNSNYSKMETVNKYIAKGFEDNKDAVHTDPVPTSSDPALIEEIKAKLDALKKEKADIEAMNAIEAEELKEMQSTEAPSAEDKARETLDRITNAMKIAINR